MSKELRLDTFAEVQGIGSPSKTMGPKLTYSMSIHDRGTRILFSLIQELALHFARVTISLP